MKHPRTAIAFHLSDRVGSLAAAHRKLLGVCILKYKIKI
jgi:hypothetical protein